MPPNRSVTIKAAFLGGKQILNETGQISKGLRDMGGAAHQAGDRAQKGSAGWFQLSKAHKEVHKGSGGVANAMGGLAKKAVMYGAGFTGVYGVKSIISSTQELTHSALKFQAMSGMSMTGAMKYTLAFKELGVGSEAGAAAYRTLSKAASTAMKQEGKFAESNRIGALALEKKRLALAKAEDSGNAYAIQTAKMNLASAKGNKEIGKQAKAFNELGINVQQWSKLKPDKQFEVIVQKLSTMTPGMARTNIMTQLLGRSGSSLAFAFNKGGYSLKGLSDQAARTLPHMKGLQKQVEKSEEGGKKASIAWESLKLTIGVKLMPILGKVSEYFAKVAEQLRSGHGTWGKLGAVIKDVAKQFLDVVKFLLKLNKEFEFAVPLILTFIAALGLNKLMQFVKWIRMSAIFLAIFAEGEIQAGAAATVMWTAVTAGIILIIFALILMVKHWDKVKVALKAVWNWIKGAAHEVGKWIMFYIGTTPIGFIIKHWKQILGFFGTLGKGILGVFEGIGQAIANVFKWIVNNTIIAYINGVLHLIHVLYKKIPDPLNILPRWPISDPAIPKLARGGDVRRSGLAIVGEHGAEAVNLPRGASVSPLSHKGGGLMGAFQTHGGDLHVHIELDKREIGLAVLREFKRLEARA